MLSHSDAEINSVRLQLYLLCTSTVFAVNKVAQ